MRRVVGKDGTRYREHLEVLAKRGRPDAIAELKGPPEPVELKYLLDMFNSLERGRRFGMNGPEPFTWENIESWARLFDEDLEPHEVDALKLLELVSLAAQQKRTES